MADPKKASPFSFNKPAGGAAPAKPSAFGGGGAKPGGFGGGGAKPGGFGGAPGGAKSNPFAPKGGAAKPAGGGLSFGTGLKKKEGETAGAGAAAKPSTPFGAKANPAGGGGGTPGGFKAQGVASSLFNKGAADSSTPKAAPFAKLKEGAAPAAAADKPKIGFGTKPAGDKPKAPAFGTKPAGETPFTKKDPAGAAGTVVKAGSTSPPPPGAAAPMKDRIKGKLNYQQVGDKLNEWNADLKKKEQEFQKQAQDIKKSDDAIRMNDVRIRMLHDKVQVIKERHKRLNGDVDVMVSRQDEISDLLRRLRERVQHDTRPMARNDAREQTFALAEEIRHRLQETHRELSSVIDQLRGSSETDDGADTNAMTHIGQILGAHVDTLVWVHQRTDTLEQRLDTLERSKQAAPGLSGY